MAAVLFNLLGEVKGAEFFSRMSVASHGAERDTGHTGNFFNMLWAMPGVAQSGPQAAGAWMREFGGWYGDLARRWDGAFPHQGPPEAERDSYAGWDASGGYLLAYAMPLKKIFLTGKRAGGVPQVDAAGAEALISDARAAVASGKAALDEVRTIITDNRQRIEQSLRGMLMRAIARIDHGTIHFPRKQLHSTGGVVANDNQIRSHRVQCHRRINQRLALFDRG
jgi:hypothetical protein